MKHYFSRAALVLLSMATVFSFTACGGDDEVTPNQDQQDQQGQQSDGIIHVERMVLKDARKMITLVLDDEEKKTYKIEANLYPENVSDKNVTILSDNVEVVSVNGDIVTAHGTGEAKVTVTTQDGGFTDYIIFKVVLSSDDADRPFGIYGYEDGATVYLTVNETLPLTFWFASEDKRVSDIQYHNSDENVVSVGANGAITALAEGAAEIRFVLKGAEYMPFILNIIVSNEEPTPEPMTDAEAMALLTENVWSGSYSVGPISMSCTINSKIDEFTLVYIDEENASNNINMIGKIKSLTLYPANEEDYRRGTIEVIVEGDESPVNLPYEIINDSEIEVVLPSGDVLSLYD